MPTMSLFDKPLPTGLTATAAFLFEEINAGKKQQVTSGSTTAINFRGELQDLQPWLQALQLLLELVELHKCQVHWLQQITLGIPGR